MTEPSGTELPRETTTDHFLLGGVVLEQPARGHGYRINVDSFLLADFAHPRSNRTKIWDLGAGVGAVGLTLAARGALDVVLVERSEWLSQLSGRNATTNSLSERVTVISGDVREVAALHEGAADLIVSNPPYFLPSNTRASPTKEIADSRSGDVTLFVQASRRLLAKRGRVCFIYPANEFVSLTQTFRTAGLEPKRVRFVHSKPDVAARVVLIELQAGKTGGLTVLPPLIETTSVSS